MIFCIHCGSTIGESDTFCGDCGNSVAPAPSVTTCIHCGQQTDVSDLFCGYCGKNPLVHGSNPQAAAGHSHTVLIDSFFNPQAQVAEVPTPPVSRGPMMPLVFLVDKSMAAAPFLAQLSASLGQFKADICSDSKAKDMLEVAIIPFSNDHIVSAGVVPITSAIISPFSPSGSASYAAPIHEAIGIIKNYTSVNPYHYKPWIILVTPSETDDDISAVASSVKAAQSAGMLRFMVLSTQATTPANVKSLTDIVFRQKGADFTAFFAWLADCIKAIARTSPDTKAQLPPLKGNVYRDK